ELIQALIRELDVVPAARAEISIFTLKRADAAQLAATLQQLFLGTTAAGGLGGGAPLGGARPGGGLPGAPGGGLPGGGLPGGGLRPLQIVIGGTTPEGIPLIDLRVTIDERTNSLIVAGSRNDLDVIETLIARLEDSGIPDRRTETYRLVNAQATDVASIINDF